MADQRHTHGRAREAITRALHQYVLREPYDGFGVKQLVAEAGVSRSTFYEHYSNKDDVLLEAMSPLLRILADVATGNSKHANVVVLLDHFLENRHRSRSLLRSQVGERIERKLAKALEERLRHLGGEAESDKRLLDVSLTARHVAGSQLVLIRSWLEEPNRNASQNVATAICATTHALTSAFSCR